RARRGALRSSEAPAANRVHRGASRGADSLPVFHRGAHGAAARGGLHTTVHHARGGCGGLCRAPSFATRSLPVKQCDGPRMNLRHVILDRDGVLNYEAPEGSYVREPAWFRWLPGALEGLALLRRAGLRLSVATNQAGVGRGIMSLEQLAAVHDRMQMEAAAHGGALDALLYCPHAPHAPCSSPTPAP